MVLPQFYVDDIIRNAIKEDISYIDMATAYVVPENDVATASLIAKEDGVLSGAEVAARVFSLLDCSACCTLFKHDGQSVQKGDVIAKITGKTVFLLQGERTALNLISHMSGIATATARAVKLTEGTNVTISDTRKTLPGLRALQKYAVCCGGGKNHRFNLSDCAMLKDNHTDACGGITKAVGKLRAKTGHTVKIEVEARNLGEVKEAVAAGADIIMLDNMGTQEMKAAVEYIGGRAITEASGNITSENIKEKASSGVDIISIGALTHSVKAFDISMHIE